MAEYKSKYYDPQKAHEYYEKHKNLKGRTKKKSDPRLSTSRLNEQGKAVAKQVRESINAEKKEYMKAVKAPFTARIKELRKQLKAQGLSTEEIKAQVESIKEEYKEIKSRVSELFKEKYRCELDNLKKDPSMCKAKKKSKKK